MAANELSQDWHDNEGNIITINQWLGNNKDAILLKTKAKMLNSKITQDLNPYIMSNPEAIPWTVEPVVGLLIGTDERQQIMDARQLVEKLTDKFFNSFSLHVSWQEGMTQDEYVKNFVEELEYKLGMMLKEYEKVSSGGGQRGGGDPYYHKYIKYKTKYQQLKNNY
jgi:hypothetical protein